MKIVDPKNLEEFEALTKMLATREATIKDLEFENEMLKESIYDLEGEVIDLQTAIDDLEKELLRVG
jgi:predicted nuclease with TOPRIM domain